MPFHQLKRVAALRHVDELGPGGMFSTPSSVAVMPDTGGRVAFVTDSANHALRRVSREMPTRLRLSVKAVDTNVYPGGGGESGYARDRILDEYGYYSVNGPPNNETTHAHGLLTYIDESHELTMCAYPSSEYFFLFKGSVQVVVSEADVGGHTYFVWTGESAGDERSENFRLRGGGCTDAAAPNYNFWAFYDDGSCLGGVRLTLEVKAVGEWGAYQIEGPGFYYDDELAPHLAGSSIVEDDVHVLTFTAWPQVIYTVQLHGALSATLVDAPGQATSFTYVNYTSTDATSQHMEAIRPAGAGCTQENFINYSPFAIGEDNSCIEARVVQIEYTSAPSVTFPADWFSYGVIEVLQPLLLGGQAAFAPVYFTSANTSSQIIVNMLPGKHPIHAFGGAKAQVVLVDNGDVLNNVDGAEDDQQRDTHGFLSTLGDSRVFFVVPETPQTRQVVSTDGGVVGSSETGSVVVGTGALAAPTVIGVAVETIELSAATTLRNDGGAGGQRGAWDVVGKVFQITPHRQRFATPVTVVIPFDEGNQPTGKGNSETVVLRASDERGLDWRVVPGASFVGGKAYVDVDHFSLLAVAARAEVRALTPLQGRVTGGTTVTLDGVDFRGVPISSASGNIFCKFGEHYQKAEFVPSREPRGFGEAVVCAAPVLAKAGFTTVEMHDAGTLLSSNGGWTMLLTAPANVTGLTPASGPAAGGALVTARGTRLSAASDDWSANRAGDAGGSGSRNFDVIDCSFGHDDARIRRRGDVGDDAPSVSTTISGGSFAAGYAISSAVAVCEAPAASPHAASAQVRVRLSNDDDAAASFVLFRYRSALVHPAANDLGGAGVRRLVGGDEGGSVVDVGFIPGAVGDGGGSGGVGFGSGGGGGGTQTGPFAPTMRCMFGTISVALRTAAGRGEGLHCVAPARSGLKRHITTNNEAFNSGESRLRDLDGYSSAEVPVLVTGAPGEPSVHVANFARLPAPRPAAVVLASRGGLTGAGVGAGDAGVGGGGGGGGGGRFFADVALIRDHPSFPAAAVWGAAPLRCAVSGGDPCTHTTTFPKPPPFTRLSHKPFEHR